MPVYSSRGGAHPEGAILHGSMRPNGSVWRTVCERQATRPQQARKADPISRNER